MNKIYRIIWNEITATWVAVAEVAKGHSKRSGTVDRAARIDRTALLTLPPLKALVASLMLIGAVAPTPIWAQVAVNQLPTGGNVVGGTASITTTPGAAVLNINQSTNRAAIDWNTFNVGSAAQVNFNQPSSSSVTLNRVLDSNPSQIFGRITAPGQVFLTTPNGVVFAPGARVDVGGLVATTHRMGVDDFMAGSTTFERNGSTGSVVNQGELNAALGGYIALLAPQVRNEGVIIAQAGTVALASGEAITLNFADNGTLAGITATQSQIAALVENKNAVLAPGGLIILSAQAMNRLQGGVINNSGSLEATGLVNDGGRIILDASDSISHTGSINVDAAANSTGNGGTALVIASLANPDSRTDINGSISARGGEFGGDGGFVETSAGRVQIGEATRVATLAPQGNSGTWLIDPTNFAIVAGSGAQTTSSIGASTLQTNLAGGNISIATSATANGTDLGNINVNAALSWSANTLTLTAHNDININAVMTASGTASLDLAPTSNKVNVALGSGGFTGSLDWTSSGALRMNVLGALQTFTVINNVTDLQAINTSGLAGKYALGANIDASAITNFVPIGDATTNFTGVFDGLGHTVSNLTINRPNTDYVGLFGSTEAALLRNVGVSGSIEGRNGVGGLVGALNQVGGAGSVGGSVSNSYATGTVSGSQQVGGLVGYMGGTSGQTSTITSSYATAAVSGSGNGVGGLVGFFGGGTRDTAIRKSYAAGTVSGSGKVGGLVGQVDGSNTPRTISESYATGAVSGSAWVGGLVGYGLDMAITNTYATGAVQAISGTGSAYGGGLVGMAIRSTIDQTYASGAVSADYSRGLAGLAVAGSTITNSYWDSDTATTSVSNGGGTGLTTANALQSANYTGFDFTNTWFMVNGQTRPMLRAFFAPDEGGGNYTISNLYQLQGMAANLSGTYVLANNINAIATASTNPSDIWAGKGFASIGNATAAAFTGDFNGQDHTISNLTINRPTTDYVGLFGRIDRATLRNVGVSGSVTGLSYVGGLVGHGDRSSITNSFASVAVTGGTNSFNAGGLVGRLSSSSITDSYALGAVTGGRKVGGLVGYGSGNSTITNSYASGSVTGATSVGGLLGYGDGSTITNSYASGPVTGATSVGGLVGYGTDTTITNSYAAGDVESTGSYVGGLLGDSDGGNSITNSYSTGDVTGRGSNVGGFIGRARSSDILNNSFYNIDAVLINGAPTVTRAGIYNAQFTEWLGHSLTLDIANSFVAGSGADAGYRLISNVTDMKALLAFAENTSYKFRMTADVDLVSVPSYHVRVFSGVEFDGATHNISNINVNAPSSDRMGLFGTLSNGSTIKNVNLVGGSVTGNSQVGGLVGFTDGGTITDSSATGEVRGNSHVGGLVGYGQNSSSISNSYASGPVTGAFNVGGLVGYGYRNTSITESYASGLVTGVGNVGGLVGKVQSGSPITRSYATGGVTGSGNNVGGLVGFGEFGSITESYATGVVRGTGNHVGGLVGYIADGSIERSYATGVVTSTGNRVGGLVGNGGSNTTITDSYASGAVTGSSYVGGLVGKFSNSTINKSLATGLVTSTTSSIYTGGLTGSGGATITNSFWNSDTPGTGLAFNDGDPTNTIGAKTTAELKTLATFTGWNIRATGPDNTGKTWRIYEGNTYPLLLAFLTPLDNTNPGPYTVTPSVWHPSTSANANLIKVNGSKYSAQFDATEFAASRQALGYDLESLLASISAYLRLIGGSSVYGDTPTLNYGLYTASSGGTLISDASPSGSVSWSTLLSNTSAANTYSLSYTSGLTLGSSAYTLSAGDAVNWIVNPRPITITAGSTSRFYGSTNPTVTSFTVPTGSNGSGSGLVNGDNINSVINTIAGTATATANAGTTHAITPSAAVFGSGSAGNYAISYANGSLTIDKANAVVTANSATGTYTGLVQSVGGFTVSGLVNSETASVLSSPTASGATGTNAGTYSNTVTGNATDGNYNLTFANGTLTIAKANAVVTANSAAGTYTGLVQSVGGFTVSGLVNGETIAVLDGVSTTGGSGTSAGSYTHTVSGTDENYNLSFAAGSLAIGKANAVVTANSDTKTYNGGAQSVTGFTASGLVNGETIAVLDSVTTSGGSGTSAAIYPHTASGTDENYSLSFLAGSLTILPVVIPPAVESPPPAGTATQTTPPDTTNSRTDTGVPISPNPLLNVNPVLVIPLAGSGGSGAALGQLGDAGISISLNMAPTGNAVDGVPAGIVTVSVPMAMATSGAGFSFDLPAQVRESLGTGAIQVTLADGSPLPVWIQFNPVAQRFEVGAVPTGGLPLQILLRKENKQVLIVISERAE